MTRFRSSHLCAQGGRCHCSPRKPDDVRISGRAPPMTSLLIPQNQIHMGVAIRTTYEHYQTPPLGHSGSFMSSEERLYDEPAREGLTMTTWRT